VLNALPTGLQNVTLFGARIFTKVIKLMVEGEGEKVTG
jgi:hypothetical protein